MCAGPQPLALVFEVWDAAGGCGTGCLLGSGRVALPPLGGVKERDPQPADVDLGEVRFGGPFSVMTYPISYPSSRLPLDGAVYCGCSALLC